MTTNTDPVRALADELEQAAAGEDIPSAAAAYADCAGRLRTLAKSLASAPPSATVGVDWPIIVEGLRLADRFFDGDDHYWQPASTVRAAYRAALAAQQQGGRAERLEEALRKIAGHRLSEFHGPHHMALSCVDDAQVALAQEDRNG